MVIVTNVGVGCGLGDGGLLEQPVEQHSSRTRTSAVEPEGEFVEVVVNMARIDRPVVSTEQPAFEQRRHPVHTRKGFMRRGTRTQNDEWIVCKTFLFEGEVDGRAVGTDRAAGRDVVAYERHQGVDRRRRDAAHPNASESLGIVDFNCYGDRDQVRSVVGLASGTRGSHPWATPQCQERFVDLNRSTEQISPLANHRPSKSVQHCPGGLVTAQPEHPLQTQRADALLLAGDVPRRREPDPQRSTCLVEDRAGRDAALVPARSANEPGASRPPRNVYDTASGTTIAVRPPQLFQVGRAGFLAGKPILELAPGARVLSSRFGFDGVFHPRIVQPVELSG